MLQSVMVFVFNMDDIEINDNYEIAQKNVAFLARHEDSGSEMRLAAVGATNPTKGLALRPLTI